MCNVIKRDYTIFSHLITDIGNYRAVVDPIDYVYFVINFENIGK